MRECGECSLCCKLLDVPSIGKAEGEWCEHASRCGLGCSIYETRPQICHTFECLWLQNEVLGEELRPDKCGVMFEPYYQENTVVVIVEKDKPCAWMEGEPLKLMQQMLLDGYTVWVMIGSNRHLLLPRGETETSAWARAIKARRRIDGSANLH